MAWSAAALAVSTAVTAGTSIYQADVSRRNANRARRQQEQAQNEQRNRARRTEQLSLEQEQRARRDGPDIASILAGLNPGSGGFLSGGVNPGNLQLGNNRPLGL